MNGRQQTFSMDKTSFSVKPLNDVNDDREYWSSKTPAERLEALEFMRQVMYEYDPVTDRLQRTIEVVQLS